MPPLRKVLVANRGEIAIRVMRAAQSLGLATVAVHSGDDAAALHLRHGDDVVELPGTGPAAYLDVDAVVAAAVESGADAVHPGYGFLSERAELARSCDRAGVSFVGPAADVLELFGDKGKARSLAREAGLPLLAGTDRPTDLAAMQDFVATNGLPVIVKAVSGGGGRGVRVVRTADDLPAAVDACRAEAAIAFGSDDLYVERLLEGARHIEVQVVGDGTGAVSHLWDRDCSVQHRHQKLVEIAPSSVLDPPVRADMLDAAVRLMAAVRYHGVATVEFLATTGGEFFFLEVNPRIQVEHTVTEEVLGLDLVAVQLRLTAGTPLAELNLLQEQVPQPVGCAVQIRVNAEQPTADGRFTPSAGEVTTLVTPTGPGVRIDAAVRPGVTVNPRFDSLIAKIVVHDRTGYDGARRRALRALDETVVGGVATNLDLQRALLASDALATRTCDTEWVDRNLPALVPAAAAGQPPAEIAVVDGAVLVAPTGGSVIAVEVKPDQTVRAGDVLVVVEAMKMEHPLRATHAGRVEALQVQVGDVVDAGQVLVHLDPHETAAVTDECVDEVDPDQIRDDLQRVFDRRAKLLDAKRPAAVERRRALGMRTARENVDDLTDGGLDVEYGGFAVAAQRKIRSEDELVERTPADGIITGLGRVNGDRFDRERSTCAVLAYDYTVLAGTQGAWGHKKADRLLTIARDSRLPVVLFAEGGGGRPGDTDVPIVGGLDLMTFSLMGSLSGLVPTVGIANGRCFAGNAALLGCCDVVIATENSSIGMAGPALIEGGGLGVFTPEEVGPTSVQRANGVIDVVTPDEAAAVAVTKQYLGYFQGDVASWDAEDQRLLRQLVPDNRKRVYDMRRVLATLFDRGSVLELRRDFAPAMLTAFARLQGRPVGVIGNNPAHLGGAIDAVAADKAARFLQLCDAFAIPVVSLCDTPGFMVGPESEKQAAVRHVSRLFVIGAHLTVPLITVVTRKAYGLGAMAMAAGSFRNPRATLGWPTSEFGAMGLEGAVRLALRSTLEAIEDHDERQRTFQSFVDAAYEMGGPINTASLLEIDGVLDPAETRAALVAALFATPGPERAGWRNARHETGVDTW